MPVEVPVVNIKTPAIKTAFEKLYASFAKFSDALDSAEQTLQLDTPRYLEKQPGYITFAFPPSTSWDELNQALSILMQINRSDSSAIAHIIKLIATQNREGALTLLNNTTVKKSQYKEISAKRASIDFNAARIEAKRVAQVLKEFIRLSVDLTSSLQNLVTQSESSFFGVTGAVIAQQKELKTRGQSIRDVLRQLNPREQSWQPEIEHYEVYAIVSELTHFWHEVNTSKSLHTLYEHCIPSVLKSFINGTPEAVMPQQVSINASNLFNSGYSQKQLQVLEQVREALDLIEHKPPVTFTDSVFIDLNNQIQMLKGIPHDIIILTSDSYKLIDAPPEAQLSTEIARCQALARKFHENYRSFVTGKLNLIATITLDKNSSISDIIQVRKKINELKRLFQDTAELTAFQEIQLEIQPQLLVIEQSIDQQNDRVFQFLIVEKDKIIQDSNAIIKLMSELEDPNTRDSAIAKAQLLLQAELPFITLSDSFTLQVSSAGELHSLTSSIIDLQNKNTVQRKELNSRLEKTLDANHSSKQIKKIADISTKAETLFLAHTLELFSHKLKNYPSNESSLTEICNELRMLAIIPEFSHYDFEQFADILEALPESEAPRLLTSIHQQITLILSKFPSPLTDPLWDNLSKLLQELPQQELTADDQIVLEKARGIWDQYKVFVYAHKMELGKDSERSSVVTSTVLLSGKYPKLADSRNAQIAPESAEPSECQTSTIDNDTRGSASYSCR